MEQVRLLSVWWCFYTRLLLLYRCFGWFFLHEASSAVTLHTFPIQSSCRTSEMTNQMSLFLFHTGEMRSGRHSNRTFRHLRSWGIIIWGPQKENQKSSRTTFSARRRWRNRVNLFCHRQEQEFRDEGTLVTSTDEDFTLRQPHKEGQRGSACSEQWAGPYAPAFMCSGTPSSHLIGWQEWNRWSNPLRVDERYGELEREKGH